MSGTNPPKKPTQNQKKKPTHSQRREVDVSKKLPEVLKWQIILAPSKIQVGKRKGNFPKFKKKQQHAPYFPP